MPARNVVRHSIALFVSMLFVACSTDESSDDDDELTATETFLPRCGNGLVEEGEYCDDGGANNDFVPNACRTTCERAWCGDNVRDSGEECDLGEANGGAECTDACLSLVDETSTGMQSGSTTVADTDTDASSTTAVESTSTAESTSSSGSTSDASAADTSSSSTSEMDGDMG